MSRAQRLIPVVHIGPPKTATTALQEGVIPRLDRPFQIKPQWANDLARKPAFEHPAPLPANIIISDEALGDFSGFVPQVIVERLAQVFTEARIIFVERDPVDLFYSFYRQRLVNGAVMSTKYLMTKGTVFIADTIDGFFDTEFERFKTRGVGVFAMVASKVNQALFAKRFDVHAIKFDLLQSAPKAFVKAFVDLCGGGPELELPIANQSGSSVIEAALAQSPFQAQPKICQRFRDYYSASLLTPDREDFIRSWAQNPDIPALAGPFPFRKSK